MHLSEGKILIVYSLVKEIEGNYSQDIFDTVHQVNGKLCVACSRADIVIW
jgi:hypothetical protein